MKIEGEGEAEARKTGFSHKAAKSAEGVDGRSEIMDSRSWKQEARKKDIGRTSQTVRRAGICAEERQI